METRLDYSSLQKKLGKLADKNPAYFDMSVRVLKTYHDNEQTLLGAIMVGLMEAYEMGVAGTPPAQNKVHAKIRAQERGEVVEDEPVTIRRKRS